MSRAPIEATLRHVLGRDWPREHPRRGAIRTYDRKRAEQELGALSSEGPQIGELLGDQDAVRQECTVHGPDEVGRAAVEREIRSRSINSEKLHALLSFASLTPNRPRRAAEPRGYPPATLAGARTCGWATASQPRQ